MKRFLWLILLLSLGLNLGLGWRLVAHPGHEGFSEGRRFGPAGGRRGSGPAADPGGPNFHDGTRPAPGDTTAWRRIMQKRLDRLAERLELNEQQYAVFQESQEAGFRDFENLRQRVDVAQRRLFALTAAEDPDPQTIRDAVADVRLFRTSLDSLVTETMLKEMSALDPQQRRRYLEIIPWVKLTGGLGGPDGRGRPGGPGGPGPRNGPGRPDHQEFPAAGEAPRGQ